MNVWVFRMSRSRKVGVLRFCIYRVRRGKSVDLFFILLFVGLDRIFSFVKGEF